MVKVVSILIPTRNRPLLAIKAVKSALLQTYGSIEVIVTDNSETEQLGFMLKSIGDDRVHYYKNVENIGPILNWRRALEISSGEYCIILPDDDYLINPFYIEDAVEILANEEISLIIPDCILSYSRKNNICTSGFSGLINGQNFIRNGLHIPHIGNVFRKEMAKHLNAFHSNDILWSDVELWMRIMAIGQVYCYSKPSVLYLFHDNNIVLNMSKAQLIANSRYIRPSVETFADEDLIAELVIRYLCVIDSISTVVDLKFIKTVIKINNLEKIKFHILMKVRYQSAKRKATTILRNAIKTLMHL
jgi:glycosyltransferase involved in cell wall biosynthesis